jgi:hypothetical protein
VIPRRTLPTEHKIKTGIVGGIYTQVLSGLVQGQSVVLADYAQSVPSSNTSTTGALGGLGGGTAFGGGAVRWRNRLGGGCRYRMRPAVTHSRPVRREFIPRTLPRRSKFVPSAGPAVRSIRHRSDLVASRYSESSELVAARGKAIWRSGLLDHGQP